MPGATARNFGSFEHEKFNLMSTKPPAKAKKQKAPPQLPLAKDLNPNAKPVGLPKRNPGWAKDIVFISDDLFEEDLRP